MNVYSTENHHHKRKQQRKKSRRLYNTREGSEGTRPPHRSLRSGAQTASSDGSDCEVDAAEVSDQDDDVSSKAPLIRSLGPDSPRNHVQGLQSSTEHGEVNVQASPTLTSSVAAIEGDDSPAIHALRSLSFQAPVRSKSQGLQRVSTALASTFNLFRPNPTVSFADVQSRKAGKKAEEASRRSSAHSKSLAYQDMNRRPPTFKESKDVSRMLETPATITLRKASKVSVNSPIKTSMGASLTCEQNCERPADAPSSELLAFYSSTPSEKGSIPSELPSPESAEATRSLRQQPTFTFDVESQSFRARSKSVSQFNDISNARRCSTPAEAALTYADVHVAPGSFATGSKSRQQSLPPAEFNRRISTVQFRSRNSVHEVIWREDETTSNSSLTTSSGTSPHAGHSFRSTPSPASSGSPTREPKVKRNNTKAFLPTVPESMSIFTKMPENLLRWNWGTSSTTIEGAPRAVDAKNDTVGPVAVATVDSADTKGDPLAQVLVNSTLDSSVASLQQSSDQQSSRFQKPSFSKLPRLQSFPHLRTRSSTAEWQKTPLVDLNDASAGRAGQYQDQKVTQFAGQSTGAGKNVKGGKEKQPSQLHETIGGKRSMSLPYANARLGPVSSPGSGIGASSRKRVLPRRKLSTNISC